MGTGRCCCDHLIYFTDTGSAMYKLTVPGDPDAATAHFMSLVSLHSPRDFDLHSVERKLYYESNLGGLYAAELDEVPDDLLVVPGYIASMPFLDQPRGKLYHLNGVVGLATEIVRRDLDGTGAVTMYTSSGGWTIRAWCLDWFTDAGLTPYGNFFVAEQRGSPLEYRIKRIDTNNGLDDVYFTSAAGEMRSPIRMEVAYHPSATYRFYWTEFNADGSGARIQRATFGGTSRETYRDTPRVDDWYEDVQWEPRSDKVWWMQRYNPTSVPGVEPAEPEKAGIYRASYAGTDPELMATRSMFVSPFTGTRNFRLGQRFTPLG